VCKHDPTTPNSTSTLQGEGSIVPLFGLMPKMTLIVDPIACTHTIDVGITLNTLHTDRDENQTRKDALIVNIHAGGRPLEPTPDIVLPLNTNFEGRSQLWAATNRDRDSFVPLGFAAELANPITNVMGGPPSSGRWCRNDRSADVIARAERNAKTLLPSKATR
jgi:hypothetical protein